MLRQGAFLAQPAGHEDRLLPSGSMRKGALADSSGPTWTLVAGSIHLKSGTSEFFQVLATGSQANRALSLLQARLGVQEQRL